MTILVDTRSDTASPPLVGYRRTTAPELITLARRLVAEEALRFAKQKLANRFASVVSDSHVSAQDAPKSQRERFGCLQRRQIDSIFVRSNANNEMEVVSRHGCLRSEFDAEDAGARR